MAEVGRDFWRPPGPLPCSSRDTYSRLPRTRGILNISENGVSTSSQGNFSHCSVTLTVNKIFPNAQRKPLVFLCGPVVLVLSLSSAEKSLGSIHYPPSLQVFLYTLMGSPLSHFCSRLKGPRSQSLFSQERCSSPFLTLAALCWTLSHEPIFLLCSLVQSIYWMEEMCLSEVLGLYYLDEQIMWTVLLTKILER